MKEKNLEVTLLLDFYGDILTDKQRAVLHYYYDEDLSLAEIAEHAEITRQGVRDSIKRGEAVLFEMEQKLGLAARFMEMRRSLEGILEAADRIARYNEKYCSSRVIAEQAAGITTAARRLIDE